VFIRRSYAEGNYLRRLYSAVMEDSFQQRRRPNLECAEGGEFGVWNCRWDSDFGFGFDVRV
ncbi:hypothetical protein A2U01_0100357, partial [Trifolium medium]|nr:hypothetical protein [Trifolium medium]